LTENAENAFFFKVSLPCRLGENVAGRIDPIGDFLVRNARQKNWDFFQTFKFSTFPNVF
jgi:hypothetical protein